MKTLAIKLLLLLASLGATFVLFEWLLIPMLVTRASLELQGGFPQTMRILAQSSKRGLIPENYVLLLGDSYAQGKGDWLRSVDNDSNPPFHSAHVLQERLGRDVISFGQGGVGSLPGMALIPARQAKALTRLGAPQPREVLIYFYGGNDLDNNLIYLERHSPGRSGAGCVLDDACFDDFLRGEVDRYVEERATVDRFFIVSYVANLIRNALARSLLESAPVSAHADAVDADLRNQIVAAGNPARLPADIQAPSLELDADETRWALQVLDRSLAYLKEVFPESEIHLVYVPSPLAIYPITSREVSVQTYLGRKPQYPADRVPARSLELRRRIRAIASTHGVGFFDSTPLLQEAARQTWLHGPDDFQHFNEAGYRLLGESLADYLKSRG